MRRFFTLLFALAIVSGVEAQVTFFGGPNYSGPSIKVFEGSISRMGSTVIGNDRLGSMIVPPGYRVTLYEHDYFRGYAETFTGSILNMSPRLFNAVSSIVVTNDKGAGWVSPQGGAQAGWNLNTVMIYSECYFGGRNNPLLPADYPTLPNNLSYNVSSIRIPAGYEMDVFTLPNFGGRVVRLRGDEWCLPPEWNNGIGSIRVYKVTSGFIPPDNYNPWSMAIEINAGMNGGRPPQPGQVIVNPNPGQVITQPGYWDQFNVMLYDQCGFSGRNAPMPDGVYGELPYGFQQNVMSVRIPQGKEIILYTGRNLTGNGYRITGDQSCLRQGNVYRVMSMRVQPINGNGGNGWVGGVTPPPPPPVIVPPPSQEVQVFTECGYQGRSMRLLPGRNIILINPFNNNISSIRVPYRRRVILFTGVNFTGHSWILTGDNSCLNAHFNNRIQSIIVEAY